MKEYIEFITDINLKLEDNDIVPQLSFSTNGDDKVINLHIDGGEITLFSDVFEGLYQDEEDNDFDEKHLIKKRVLNNLYKIKMQIDYVLNTIGGN